MQICQLAMSRRINEVLRYESHLRNIIHILSAHYNDKY
uniref:Transcriptional regulator n=1 Tax=Heterorhabditis bacteriophora TaxID=37862 RepID=A0A1I7WPJ7_HETBA